MQLQAFAPITPDRDALVAVDLPEPRAMPGEVVLQVHACGVCHTELDQVEVRVPTPLPRVPGHQVVGTVVACGDGVAEDLEGRHVGVGWIASACGECRWCRRGEENLCPAFQGTGRDRDGGDAERMAIAAAFAVPLPDGIDDLQAAPSLRTLR